MFNAQRSTSNSGFIERWTLGVGGFFHEIHRSFPGDLANRPRASVFCCRNEEHSCLRRQFIGRLHAPTKRSLSGFGREETAGRRPELSSNQRERVRRHDTRRLGTASASS